jgi:hypothetical protein
MLKIQVWMRGTMEYSRDTIPGPTPDQTQSEFEEAFEESDECYFGGEVWETCSYFNLDEDSSDLVKVYVDHDGSDSCIDTSETPVLETSNWNHFEFVRGGGVNLIPEPCDDLSQVRIWWCHDMKCHKIFYWKNVNEFDPKQLKLQYGIDQDGRKYLEDLLYGNESPDDSHDYGDTGFGYNGINFIYHPSQRFAGESEGD